MHRNQRQHWIADPFSAGAVFVAGCCLLPLFWLTNFWLFWPYLRGKRHDAHITKCALSPCRIDARCRSSQQNGMSVRNAASVCRQYCAI